MSEEKEFYVGSVDSGRSLSPSSSVQNLERLLQGSSLASANNNSAVDLVSQSGRSLKGGKAKENRSYLWGPTGEQEWSPNMTTGMPQFSIQLCTPMHKQVIPVTQRLTNIPKCSPGAVNMVV